MVYLPSVTHFLSLREADHSFAVRLRIGKPCRVCKYCRLAKGVCVPAMVAAIAGSDYAAISISRNDSGRSCGHDDGGICGELALFLLPVYELVSIEHARIEPGPNGNRLTRCPLSKRNDGIVRWLRAADGNCIESCNQPSICVEHPNHIKARRIIHYDKLVRAGGEDLTGNLNRLAESQFCSLIAIVCFCQWQHHSQHQH